MSDEQNNNNQNESEKEISNDTSNNEEVTENKDECEKQRDEYLKGWQRAKADLINYKKEETDRLTRAVRYATEDIIKDVISIVDNFDLGLRALEKQGTVEKGVYMIRSHVEDVLRKRGVQRISIKPGDEFDPQIAEAISVSESEEYPEGTVIEEIESGYEMDGKVIRPARVRVSKNNK